MTERYKNHAWIKKADNYKLGSCKVWGWMIHETLLQKVNNECNECKMQRSTIY